MIDGEIILPVDSGSQSRPDYETEWYPGERSDGFESMIPEEVDHQIDEIARVMRKGIRVFREGNQIDERAQETNAEYPDSDEIIVSLHKTKVLAK